MIDHPAPRQMGRKQLPHRGDWIDMAPNRTLRRALPHACIAAVGRSEAQHQGKGIVYSPKLVSIEASGGMSQALWIDNDSLLDQNAGLITVQADGWAERGWTRTGRGRRHEGRAQCHELFGLNDDGIPGTSLLPSACAAWGGQPKDLSANQVSRGLPEPVRPSARGRSASQHDPLRQPPIARPPPLWTSASDAWRQPPGERCARPRSRSLHFAARPSVRQPSCRPNGHEETGS